MTPAMVRHRAIEAAQDAFAAAPQEGLAPWRLGVEAAIAAYERALWQPIETALTERGATVDLWVRSKMTEVTGRGYRIADCHPDGKGSWLHRGQWVTGRRFFDADGERCFDPYDTGPDATVATHWRPLPAGPGDGT